VGSKIYVVSAPYDTGTPVYLYAYDTDTDAWICAPQVPLPPGEGIGCHGGPHLLALANGHVGYLHGREVGGHVLLYIYSPAEDVWQTVDTSLLSFVDEDGHTVDHPQSVADDTGLGFYLLGGQRVGSPGVYSRHLQYVKLQPVACPLVTALEAAENAVDGACDRLLKSVAKSSSSSRGSISGPKKPRPMVDIVRRFRDRLLTSSNDGAELAALYYRHSPEIRRMMAENPSLALETLVTLGLILPSLKSAVTEPNDTVTVDSQTYARGYDLLREYEGLASEPLRLSLTKLERFLETRSYQSARFVTIRFDADELAMAVESRHGG
jgi:hypothetical protein